MSKQEEVRQPSISLGLHMPAVLCSRGKITKPLNKLLTHSRSQSSYLALNPSKFDKRVGLSSETSVFYFFRTLRSDLDRATSAGRYLRPTIKAN